MGRVDFLMKNSCTREPKPPFRRFWLSILRKHVRGGRSCVTSIPAPVPKTELVTGPKSSCENIRLLCIIGAFIVNYAGLGNIMMNFDN